MIVPRAKSLAILGLGSSVGTPPEGKDYSEYNHSCHPPPFNSSLSHSYLSRHRGRGVGG